MRTGPSAFISCYGKLCILCVYDEDYAECAYNLANPECLEDVMSGVEQVLVSREDRCKCKPSSRLRVQMDMQMHTTCEMLSVEQALASLKWMAKLPSVENLIYVMQKCREKKNLAYAKYMHLHIHENGLEAHRALGNYLVPMLVECGSVSDAWQAFYRLVHRNEHAWTSLIQGFVECGECQHALSLFQEMQEDCVHPSRYTLQALLKACARLKYFEKGLQIHADIAMQGYDIDPFVGNTLVDMYAKCGSFTEAWEVFLTLPGRDVISWNALMSGCAEHMLCEEALMYLKQMRMEGLCPDIVTFLCSLKACGSIGDIERGRKIHTEIVVEGLEKDPFIGNTLVDVYAKCGSPVEALEVFGELEFRGVDSWNALITGYAEHGLGEEALNFREQMQLEGVSPDAVTFICSLKVCGEAGFIDKGREIHDEVAKEGFEIDSFLGNTLVDMYAKCGSLGEAQEVFDKLLARDIVSWNALLAGYARQGQSERLFHSFETMMEEGIPPDWITFLSALSVCSHAGLVGIGQQFFEAMITYHGIMPTSKHHNCMVDLFGRAGQLNEALAVMRRLSPQPSGAIWKTVLGACQTWGSVEIGKHAFGCAVRLDDKDARAFVLMSNLYADAHMWGDVENIKTSRANTETWKEPGKSPCTHLWWE